MRNEALNAGTAASRQDAPVTASRYWLQKHVYLCVARGHVVMLDLKRDKYLSVSSPEELAPWVAGWPVTSRPPGDAVAGSDTPAHEVIPASLAKLARAGILTTDPASGKTAELTAIPKPCSELVPFQFGVRPRVKHRHAMAIGRAWLTTRIAFSRRSIQRQVERVQERKARAGQGSWDTQQARDVVTAFLWLRPLYYSRRDACLFDSLVLLELLARYELFPTWVFGIKLAPFAAHCWIQDRDVVWNDTPEHAASYTPILGI